MTGISGIIKSIFYCCNFENEDRDDKPGATDSYFGNGRSDNDTQINDKSQDNPGATDSYFENGRFDNDIQTNDKSQADPRATDSYFGNSRSDNDTQTNDESQADPRATDSYFGNGRSDNDIQKNDKLQDKPGTTDSLSESGKSKDEGNKNIQTNESRITTSLSKIDESQTSQTLIEISSFINTLFKAFDKEIINSIISRIKDFLSKTFASQNCNYTEKIDQTTTIECTRNSEINTKFTIIQGETHYELTVNNIGDESKVYTYNAKIIQPNAIYEGPINVDSDSISKNGYGTETYFNSKADSAQSLKVKGQFENGKRNGIMTIEYSDGTSATAEFENGEFKATKTGNFIYLTKGETYFEGRKLGNGEFEGHKWSGQNENGKHEYGIFEFNTENNAQVEGINPAGNESAKPTVTNVKKIISSGISHGIPRIKAIIKYSDGTTYEGSYKSSKNHEVYRHGFGLETRPDGIKIQGTWRNDKLMTKKSKVTILYPDQRSFSGQFKIDGKKIYMVKGILTLKDRTKVEGEWLENTTNELNTEKGIKITYPDGKTYSGFARFENGNIVRQGKGTERYCEGTSIQGMWKDNELDTNSSVEIDYGYATNYKGTIKFDEEGNEEYLNGTMTSHGGTMKQIFSIDSNGSSKIDTVFRTLNKKYVTIKDDDTETIEDDYETYRGQVQDGKPHGYGHYIYSKQSDFLLKCGRFENGRLVEGTIVDKKNNRYTGQWDENDNPKDIFSIIYADNRKYKGAVKRTQDGTLFEPHGKGRLKKVNQDRYEGDFKSGKKEGSGTFITITESQSKETYEGEFLDDKFHGFGTYTNTKGIFIGVYENSCKKHGIFETKNKTLLVNYSDPKNYLIKNKPAARIQLTGTQYESIIACITPDRYIHILDKKKRKMISREWSQIPEFKDIENEKTQAESQAKISSLLNNSNVNIIENLLNKI